MAFLPISTAQCHDKFWFRPQRFGFARHQGLVELIAAELPSAACALPIGFIPTPEGHYQPVAVLGIEPNRNLYVAQDETWLAQDETKGHPLCFDDAMPLS